MKKFLPILVILLALTGSAFAQFSLDKFLSEKVSKPDRQNDLNLEELMKNSVDAKLGKIAIKVVNAKLKDGRIIFKSIANAVLKDEEAKKLNDLLKKTLTAKLGKVTKENVINNVKNNMWARDGGLSYMLTYSGNMTLLMIMVTDK